MNTITLEDTLRSLENLEHQVHLDGEIIRRARTPIDRMISIR
jgi:quinolinate synthase